MCGSTEVPAGGSVRYNLPQKVEVAERGGKVALGSGGWGGRGLHADCTEKRSNYYSNSAEEGCGRSEIDDDW